MKDRACQGSYVFSKRERREDTGNDDGCLSK